MAALEWRLCANHSVSGHRRRQFVAHRGLCVRALPNLYNTHMQHFSQLFDLFQFSDLPLIWSRICSTNVTGCCQSLMTLVRLTNSQYPFILWIARRASLILLCPTHIVFFSMAVCVCTLSLSPFFLVLTIDSLGRKTESIHRL